jgi:hypothetical protein
MPDEVRQRLLPAADPRSGTPPSVAGSIASISTNGPSRLQHSASNSSLHAPAGFGGGSYAQDNRSFSSRQDGGHISGSSPLGSPLGSPIGASGPGSSTFDRLAGGASQSSMPHNGSGSGRSRVEPSAMSVSSLRSVDITPRPTLYDEIVTVKRLAPNSHDAKCQCEQPVSFQVRKSVAEIRREGWVYRESTYLDSVVNQRYGAIYPHALVTFRWGICAAVLLTEARTHTALMAIPCSI